jgi:hypothetical protein
MESIKRLIMVRIGQAFVSKWPIALGGMFRLRKTNPWAAGIMPRHMISLLE